MKEIDWSKHEDEIEKNRFQIHGDKVITMNEIEGRFVHDKGNVPPYILEKIMAKVEGKRA